MKPLIATAVGLTSMLASGVSSAQNDDMMNGGGMSDVLCDRASWLRIRSTLPCPALPME